MRHLMILIALLAVAGLDLIFVTYSPTAPSALTFAVLAFLILLLLSVSAGSQAKSTADFTGFLRPWLSMGFSGFLVRLGVGTLIPLVFLLAASFVPDIDGPLEAVELGRTLSIFWLVATLALVGAALAFLSPRTGIFEAVLVGGLIVLARSVISWVKVDADREVLQLALFGQMIWPSMCLIGAWVGLALREITDCHLYRVEREAAQETTPDLSGDVGTVYYGEEAPERADSGAVSSAEAVPSQPVGPSTGEDRGL
ncbi:MAG: hypothetical protein ACE5Q6_05980 [Dehalococcoidia bacterium]